MTKWEGRDVLPEESVGAAVRAEGVTSMTSVDIVKEFVAVDYACAGCCMNSS